MHYNSIKFNTDDLNRYSFSNGDKIINGLNKINIFIGSNNSGKSTFLRELFINPKVEIKSSELGFDDFNKAIVDIKKAYADFLQEQGFKKINGIDFDQLEVIEYITKVEILKKLEQIKTITFEIQRILQDGESFSAQTLNSNSTFSIPMHVLRAPLIPFLQIINGSIDLLIENTQNMVGKRIYIPTIRGLRSINPTNQHESKDLSQDYYWSRTYKDYFEKRGIDSMFEIYTGFSFFRELKEKLLGNHTERDSVRKFETFLSKYFFNKQDVAITPTYEGDMVSVKIGNDLDFPISNLGDGLQTIMILTYPLFFNSEPIQLFIEEPDLFLHPGYQRVFLDLIKSDDYKKHQYYLTTHSNHFLEMTMESDDISVYRFKKNSWGEFKIDQLVSRETNILDELGVRNGSVFLSNCTIWVEGITDRIYLKKFLELYITRNKGINYLEDLHYSFLEYGGANIFHWSFEESNRTDPNKMYAHSICNRVFLVADNITTKTKGKSNDVSAKEALLQDLHTKLGDDNFYQLNSLEIENTFTPLLLSNICNSFRKTSRYVESDFNEKKYKMTYLGSYIDSIQKSSRTYANSYGTLNNNTKKKFAFKAIGLLNDYNDLSHEQKEITEKLYNFIKVHNEL